MMNISPFIPWEKKKAELRKALKSTLCDYTLPQKALKKLDGRMENLEYKRRLTLAIIPVTCYNVFVINNNYLLRTKRFYHY